MSSTTFTTPATRPADGLRPARLLWAGPLVAVAAALATTLVAWLALQSGVVATDFALLQPPAVFIATVIQVGLGALVFALILRFARRPLRTWQIVATVALILSFSNPLLAGAGLSPVPGAVPAAAVVTLMVLHVIAGVITIFGLPALTREK